MMGEIDLQLGDQKADLVITPAGVGSLAQAVVSHYKTEARSTKVVTVEPDTAACINHNLRSGRLQSIETTPTIMNGLNCGTVSTTAWPILKTGLDASVTISDFEAHEALLYLSTQGISVGPCGAASLAALRRLNPSDKATLGVDEMSTVVLLATEGERAYKTPLSHPVDPSGLNH
jgi:threonine dehydratase